MLSSIRERFISSEASVFISLCSLAASIFSLVVTIYFSHETIKYQAESNNIQHKYSDFEKNSKIGELLSEYHRIINQKIDYNTKIKDKDLVMKINMRNKDALMTLNNLYLITNGQDSWGEHIKILSDFPLRSVKRRNEKVSCNYWSPEFKKFILTDASDGIDSCTICRDTNCDN